MNDENVATKGNDRVQWGMSRKFTDGNYGSIEVHHSISSEVGLGESLEQANKRVFLKVEEDIQKAIKFKEKQLRSSNA